MTNQAKPDSRTSHADLSVRTSLWRSTAPKPTETARFIEDKCRGLAKGDAPSRMPRPLHRPSCADEIAISWHIDDVQEIRPDLPTNNAARFCNRRSAVTMQAWASIGMFSQFTPTTSFRRKAKHRRLKPPTARAGSSGAGFFHHVKRQVTARRRVSNTSIAPGPRTCARAQENNFPLRVRNGGDDACRQDLARRATCVGLRVKFFSCPATKAVDALHSDNNTNQGEAMGLDMYAYATAEKLASAVDFQEPENSDKLHYWRKHPSFMDGWKRFTSRRAGKDPDLNLSPVISLNSADLDRLEAAVRGKKLPDTGFFFAVSIIGSEAHDLAFIAKARAGIAAGNDCL